MEELHSRQEELSRINSELEDTNRGVVALYAELDEKADHLRRADEVKTKFLSNMSHEFRTPVNSILALTRLLLDRSDGELTSEQDGEAVFAARGLETENFGPIDLSVRPGEVVGVAGLIGSGRSTLLHLVMGARAATAGEMTLAGKPYRPRNTYDAVMAGVGLVPEDRKAQALLVDAPIRWNVTLSMLRRISWHGLFLQRRAERRIAAEMVRVANVVCQTPEQPARSLSGGNQQRMIFGRWIAVRPRFLLLDDPTRGVDVGAKAEIYKLIEEEREKGMAILVVSSELEELVAISHRIVVLRRGRLVAEFDRASFAKEPILAAAAFGSQA